MRRRRGARSHRAVSALCGHLRRLSGVPSEATGFWSKWDSLTKQYDHPGVLVAVDRGWIIRMRASAPVPPVYISEVLQELRGKFVASYPLPGRVAFRCFQYDPASRR
jgi:hypothetical protein